MNFDEHEIDKMRELGIAAKLHADELDKEAEEARKVEQAWARLLEYIQKGWPAHVLNTIEEKSAHLRRLKTDPENIVETLEKLSLTAKEDLEILKRRFPNLLDQECQKAGLTIHVDSRHPRYYFRDKFLILDVNEQQKSARLSSHEGRIDDFPFDIAAVVEAVQRHEKRLFCRKFNGKSFLSQLRNQYLAVAKKQKVEDGASIPIRAITSRLGKNKKGFKTDEFLIDLSRLVEEGPLEIDDRRLDLQQTKDTNQGMLLHKQTSRGYVGFIVFRKDEP